MLVQPGAVGISTKVFFCDDSGLPLTGKVAADFPTIHGMRTNTAPIPIPLHDVAIGSAWYGMGGNYGVSEYGDGWYRVDGPDALWTTASEVNISGEASGKHVISESIQVLGLLDGPGTATAVLDAASASHVGAGTVGLAISDVVPALADLVTLLARTDPTAALTAIKAVTDHLATMINGTPAFTAPALALAPSGGGGGGDSAATILAAFKADAEWKEIHGAAIGEYTNTPPSSLPGVGVLVLKDKTGSVTLATITLNYDANGVITVKSVA